MLIICQIQVLLGLIWFLQVFEMNKQLIKALVEALLLSAENRGTNQGVLIFNKVLELLEQSNTHDESVEILCKLNKALVGIEAHGDLTDDEFTVVRQLRDIEQSNG